MPTQTSPFIVPADPSQQAIYLMGCPARNPTTLFPNALAKQTFLTANPNAQYLQAKLDTDSALLFKDLATAQAFVNSKVGLQLEFASTVQAASVVNVANAGVVK